MPWVGSSLLAHATLIAQDHFVDSLGNLVGNYKKYHSLKVDLLNRVAFQLYPLKIEKSLEYAEQSLQLSKQLGYIKVKQKHKLQELVATIDEIFGIIAPDQKIRSMLRLASLIFY